MAAASVSEKTEEFKETRGEIGKNTRQQSSLKLHCVNVNTSGRNIFLQEKAIS